MITYKDWDEFEDIHREMVDDMLDAFLDRLEDKYAYKIPTFYTEYALYIMLRENQSELPVLDYYFHKAFREIDVLVSIERRGCFLGSV